MPMSRAFVKEDDGERGNTVADIQFREAKVEWLKIRLTSDSCTSG